MSYDPRQPLRAANIPPVYLPNGTINPAYVAIHRMQAANFVRGVTINQQPKPAPAKPKSQAVKVDKQKIIEEDSEDEVGDSLEDQHFATVCTDSLEALGLRQHPNRVAEAASLSSVPAPDRQYALRLPAHVMRGNVWGRQQYGTSCHRLLSLKHFGNFCTYTRESRPQLHSYMV